MSELTQTTHVKEIERIIEHLNENWINDKTENLEQYFHNHVVMIESGTNRRISGREQVLDYYREFAGESDVSDFKITDLLVDVFAPTAIAYFSHRIRYRVESTNYDEQNTEIMVFRRHNDHWEIIWRTLMPGQ